MKIFFRGLGLGLGLALLVVDAAQGQFATIKLTACQQAHAMAYQTYWAQRNRLQANAANNALSTDDYRDAMIDLNGVWRPYLREIAKVNQADNNAPACQTLAERVAQDLTNRAG